MALFAAVSCPAYSGECPATGCLAKPSATLDDILTIKSSSMAADVPLTPGLLAAPAPDDATAAPLPLDVKPAGTGYSVRTGLGTIRDYNARLVKQKIDSAKALAPSTLKLPPAPPPQKPAVDVWTAIEAPAANGTAEGAIKASTGADITLSKTTNAGVSLERNEAAASAASTSAASEKASAYVAIKAAPMLSIDTKGQWETLPSAAAGAESNAAAKQSVSIAPRLNHQFKLDNGKTLEPYATYKHEIDVGRTGAAAQALTNTQSAGAGVTFAKPESYSMTVSTDVEGLGTSEPANVKGQLQLKLPLD